MRGGGRLFIVRKIFRHEYNDIISVENLLLAWQEFIRGKKNRKDVQEFQLYLMKNIFELHFDLKNKTYQHSKYQKFNISDPKPREINKASVRDRLLHHAIYQKLYPFFDKKFIGDSYSCRNGKGTHKAINQFEKFYRKVSKNHTKTCWVLKCDIKKFFASINHQILKDVLIKYISDKDILNLLSVIIDSFETNKHLIVGKNSKTGLPLGNLTSQLLVNIYMNEFDHFVKGNLKIKYYVRYADDFVFLSTDKKFLEKLIPKIGYFLETNLKLTLHPNKVSIKNYSSGVDFLGWVHFDDHKILRTNTKNRMFKKLQFQLEKFGEINEDSRQSYLGLLSHGNTYKIQQEIRGK